MTKYFSAALLCAILGMPGIVAQGEQEPFIPITDEMLLNPDPKDWLMHYRTFDFFRVLSTGPDQWQQCGPVATGLDAGHGCRGAGNQASGL